MSEYFPGPVLRTPESRVKTIAEWRDFARRDDCLERMVPSDLRTILSAWQRLEQRVQELETEGKIAIKACNLAAHLKMALGLVAEYPLSDRKNMDSMNMQHIAKAALRENPAPAITEEAK